MSAVHPRDLRRLLLGPDYRPLPADPEHAVDVLVSVWRRVNRRASETPDVERGPWRPEWRPAARDEDGAGLWSVDDATRWVKRLRAIGIAAIRVHGRSSFPTPILPLSPSNPSEVDHA